MSHCTQLGLFCLSVFVSLGSGGIHLEGKFLLRRVALFQNLPFPESDVFTPGFFNHSEFSSSLVGILILTGSQVNSDSQNVSKDQCILWHIIRAYGIELRHPVGSSWKEKLFLTLNKKMKFVHLLSTFSTPRSLPWKGGRKVSTGSSVRILKSHPLCFTLALAKCQLNGVHIQECSRGFVVLLLAGSHNHGVGSDLHFPCS